jgi:hypothetical protein
MFYVTGDTHGDFKRFAKRERMKLPFVLGENDYVIVCGDFGLLWNKKDKEFAYNIEWLSRLPFTILFVDGNHEGFTLLNEYPVETWHGGKVHHIVKDKIIHLMRGQVFHIERKKIFTFGGASSHDIQGGILDKSDKNYDLLRKKAIKQGLPYRVINESWWKEELPSEEEMQEGIANLEKAAWKVDYVISHCASNRVQDKISSFRGRVNEKDILTDYFEELEQKLQYKHHYFGHYHLNRTIDENHTVLYKDIIRLGTKYVEE